MHSQMEVSGKDDGDSARRSAPLAALMTLILGIGMGHMYAGLLMRGVGLLLISFVLLLFISIMVNFIPVMSYVLLAGVFVVKIFAVADAYIIGGKGRLKDYNRWYFYIVAFIVLRFSIYIITLSLKSFVITAYVVPSGAMEPTIWSGDRIFGARLVYRFNSPQRGDIVTHIPLRNVTSEPSRVEYVKRVVAVAGDIIEVRNQRLIINGKPVNEPYIKEPPHYNMPPVKVPKGTVFVMGDHRNNSNDSHVWGALPVGNIKTKIIFRFWPLSHVGILI